MSVTDVVFIGMNDGEPIAYLGPVLRESLPRDVLEGLARRQLVATTGACPCGARLRIPNRAERRAAARGGHLLFRVAVEHQDDCPAIDPRLDRLGARS